MLSFPSGKSYIGQTIKSVQKRFKDHCSPRSQCRLLLRAIQKYGADNVRVELITTVDTQEKADDTETELIKFFGTLSPNGYNLTTGGSIYRKNVVQSEETKKRRARSITGRPVSEETRRRTAQSLRGGRFPHRSYPVIRTDEDGNSVRFVSVTEAIENTPGSRQSGIWKCVSGHLFKHCQYEKGKYYRWVKDTSDINTE